MWDGKTLRTSSFQSFLGWYRGELASADTKIPGPDALSIRGLVKMHQAEVLQGWAPVKSPASVMSPPFPGVLQGTGNICKH